MSKEKIEVKGAEVYGPYSSGIKAGGMIYLAGQIAPEAGDDITAQTSSVLAKIDVLLTAAGIDRHSLVFVQVLLAEIDDFAAMNEIYGKWLEDCDCPPARAAFGGNDLPRGALVEIVVQAVDENCC
jgi:2-iminobutanoate/2-iminopropanoate deaminase